MLGLAVDEELSPALLEKVTDLGAKLPSFRDAHESLGVLLRLEIGLKVYVRWINWIWQGNVLQVIAELAARQQQLGLPNEDDGETVRGDWWPTR